MRARFRKTLELSRCAARCWSSDNSSNAGAALAFYCAFFIAPLLVILLTLLGLFVNERDAAQQVNVQLSSLFGASTAQVLLEAAHSSQRVEGVTAAIVSIVTLLIGATTVLASLQTALELMWGGQRAQISGIRSWVRTRLLSLGFILTLGFLLLISTILSTALSNLQSHFATAYPGLVTLPAAADFLLSLLLVSGLFALIYRYMPSRRGCRGERPSGEGW